jgi:hypothetical protein
VGQFHASARRTRGAQRGKLIFVKRPLHGNDDHEVQLGRNLAAAFIGTCHGIGLDYARKKSASQPVGEYWIALARKVIADLNQKSAQPTRALPIQ